jgi:hypothetical protein
MSTSGKTVESRHPFLYTIFNPRRSYRYLEVRKCKNSLDSQAENHDRKRIGNGVLDKLTKSTHQKFIRLKRSQNVIP